MSVIDETGEKILLPRTGLDEFWELVRRKYAGLDPRCWKYLAMLALRENAGWSAQQIGWAFEHPRGHVTRCLHHVKAELRAHLQAAPEYRDWNNLGFSDPDRADVAADAPASRWPGDFVHLCELEERAP